MGCVWLVHCKVVTVETIVDPFGMSVQFVVSTAIIFVCYTLLFCLNCALLPIRNFI
jgi:hypothetical protein